MGNKLIIIFILLFFISCNEEYFLVQNEAQLEGIQRLIEGMEWELVDIDTFWNIDRKNILKYRITYKPSGAKCNKELLIEEIKRIFELDYIQNYKGELPK